MKKILVFIPTYNEVGNIEKLVEEIFKVLPQCEILIVDDNSPDGTSLKVQQLQKKYNNLHLIVRKENRGRGYAGIVGFKKAIELGADIIVEMDGDLSHSPEEIPKLIETLQKTDCDIVVGSRYISGGKDVERNIIRRLISLFARIYLKIITGVPVEDLTSGFNVYKDTVIKTILPYLTASDPFIVTEIKYLCKIFKFKFKEVPIQFRQRYSGKSKLSFSKLFKYLFKTWWLVLKWFFNDKYNLWFLKFLLLSNILRMILIPLFGLTDDESHYWQYAQYLDFSYYDHPPMVGYLIYIFTKLLGNNLYAVRLPALCCFIVANKYFYLLLKQIWNSKVAFYSTILLNFVPVFFAGSLITIPDAPLGMFWTMYIFYFYKFVKERNAWWLYLCGIILGLAGLSKYNAILLFISTLMVLLYFKELRKWLLKKEFYIFCLIVLTVVSPVILWNIVHKFVSFRYQLLHGFGNKSYFSIVLFLKNFIGQSMYISPILFLLLWYYIFLVIFTSSSWEEKFLLFFALPGVVLFNVVSFKNQILPHWVAMSYVTILPFTVVKSKHNWEYLLSFITATFITTAMVAITIFSLVPIPKSLENADTPDKLYGWEVAAKELANLIENQPQRFVLTHKHYVAGQLRFAYAQMYNKEILQKKKLLPEIFCINDYVDQYDFWNQNLAKFNGKDGIFVTEGRFPIKDILPEYPFKKVNLISIVSIKRNKNTPTRKFEFYLCENFDYNKLNPKFSQTEYNNFVTVKEYFRDYDKKIFLKINKSRFLQLKLFRYISYAFTTLGNGIVLIPIVTIAIYLIDKKKFWYNWLFFIFIALSGGTIVQGLKFWFDKPRPLKLFTDILHQNINVIGESLKEFGFPSGHTFVAFATAVFLANRIKKRFITVLLVIIAFCVGISRICVGAHFLSDVIGGIIIGVLYPAFWLKLESMLTNEPKN